MLTATCLFHFLLSDMVSKIMNHQKFVLHCFFSLFEKSFKSFSGIKYYTNDLSIMYHYLFSGLSDVQWFLSVDLDMIMCIYMVIYMVNTCVIIEHYILCHVLLSYILPMYPQYNVVYRFMFFNMVLFVQFTILWTIIAYFGQYFDLMLCN